MTRAKGLKRVEHHIDVVKMIRKFFIYDVVTKHILTSQKMAELTSKGKFVIEPNNLQDHKLSSEDSAAEATVVIEDLIDSGRFKDSVNENLKAKKYTSPPKVEAH